MSELKTGSRILMIGIGNNGRSDDALGWNFVDKFSERDDIFDIEHRYQLQIEDALLITEYKKVIFVDASHKDYENGFSFYKCIPARTEAFTTHKLEPETVLWLANDLFNQSPEVYVMAITGVNWELQQGITKTAQENFDQAVSFFKNWLNKKTVSSSVN
jgi:hydrogenase maturation protease